MSGLLHILVVGVTAFFISIPWLNSNVFRTGNINETVVRGREGLNAVNELLASERFDAAMDTARKLIHEYRQDSTRFFTKDITDWQAFIRLLRSDSSSFAKSVVLSHLEAPVRDTLSTIDTTGTMPPWDIRYGLVSALNAVKDDYGFFVNNRDAISLEKSPRATALLDTLLARGILTGKDATLQLGGELSGADTKMLQRFQVLVLQDCVLDGIVDKDTRIKTTWASEYIVQTSMFYIGVIYQLQKEIERQIETYERMVALYPSTIYAEQLFYRIAEVLYTRGQKLASQGKTREAQGALRRAIGYAERVEMNREVAKEFEKYQYRDMHVGRYVNLDKASITAQEEKSTSGLYTLDKQKKEVAGEKEAGRGGFLLEDVIMLIGKCYMRRHIPDSARMQFNLILTHFPESDNVDAAQLMIARTYIQQAQLALQDSTRADSAARRIYQQAIDEMTRFINVYIHSDSMSKAYIYLAGIYHDLDREEAATQAFQNALDHAKGISEKAKIQYNIGTYYFEEGQYLEAARAYEVVVTNYGSTRWAQKAQYYIGESYLAHGDSSRAIEEYKKVVSFYKRSELFSSAAMKVGSFYFRRDDYEQARKYFNLGYVYDQKGPLAPRLKYQSGMVWVEVAHNQQQDDNTGAAEKAYKEAIKEFKTVTSQYPDTRDADKAHFQIAECQMELGNQSEAREASNNIRSRDILVESIRLFGVGADNYQQELAYWRQSLEDAIEDEEKATILYEIGNIYLEKAQDNDSARMAYEKAYELTEDENKALNIRVGMARVYTNTRQYEKAQQVYTQLLEQDMLDQQLRKQLKLRLYDVFFLQGAYEKAAGEYKAFYTQYPDHHSAPYARFREASCYAKQGRHELALQKLQTLLKKYPGADIYDNVVAETGTQMIESGMVEQGVAYLEEYLQKKPLDSIASADQILLKLGNTYLDKLDNPETAKQKFSRIVSQLPNSAVFSYCAYKVGILEKRLGNKQEALEAFGRVREADRKLYQAANAEIGKILAQSDPQRAIESYRKVVELAQTQEESTKAMIGIGDVYMSIEKWDTAAQTFRQVYRAYTGADTALIAGAMIKWINALHNAARYEATIRVADTMQEKYPHSTYTINSYYFEAQSYFAQKRYTAARRRFETIIERDESAQLTEIAYYQKADCYYFNTQYAAAIRGYATYLEKYPGGTYRANALYMQGNAYWTQKDYTRARRSFEAILQQHPGFKDMCNVKRLLAYSYDELGDWQRALELYNQVLGGGCSGEAVKFAREQKEKILTQH
jgi:tetratricopeptide (TPR) repeat protein